MAERSAKYYATEEVRYCYLHQIGGDPNCTEIFLNARDINIYGKRIGYANLNIRCKSIQILKSIVISTVKKTAKNVNNFTFPR